VSFEPDKVRLVVAGRDFTRWVSYSLQTNVFRPPATFQFEIGKVDYPTIELLQPGALVEIFIDVNGTDQRYMTGRIGQRKHSYGPGQHNLMIAGADLSQELMVTSAPFGFDAADRAFGDVVEDMIEPWGIKLAYTNELGRFMAVNKGNWKKQLKGHTSAAYFESIKALQKANKTKGAFKAACIKLNIPPPPHVHDGIMKKAKDAKVDPGESVWRFIERMANKAEVKMWMTPDGWLVINRPNYDQEPTYIISHRPDFPKENNVIAGTEELDIDGIPTSLTAFGKVRGEGGKRQPYAAQELSTVLANARDKYDLHRPMFANEADARTVDEFKKRAFYAMKDAEKNFATYNYTVSGHSQNGNVWTPDTVARMVDDTLDINAPLYISGVKMSRGRTGGSAQKQITELQLTDLNAWVPDIS